MIEPWMNVEETGILGLQGGIQYLIKNWFYLKSDLILHYQYNTELSNYIDDQSGIGLALAAGLSIPLSESVKLKIQPTATYFSVISFNPDDYQQRFLLSGISAGISSLF